MAPRAIQKIRGRYTDAKIVLYSSESDIERRAQESGVTFLRKGEVLPNALAERIKAMLPTTQSRV